MGKQGVLQGGRLGVRFWGKVPAIDVSETDAGVDVTAELPGVDEADVDVNLNNRVLTIKGEKRAEKETKIAIGKG